MRKSNISQLVAYNGTTNNSSVVLCISILQCCTYALHALAQTDGAETQLLPPISDSESVQRATHCQTTIGHVDAFAFTTCQRAAMSLRSPLLLKSRVGLPAFIVNNCLCAPFGPVPGRHL
ncbi:unnamed protein product [Polarella glacialis]|uniref:Uncharacterized protein n=1 Tax=Polarella glacialis TaxID=89957 RepID=A0A813E749_POLGL|nr:unnamed protein product [Polarella glacialis]